MCSLELKQCGTKARCAHRAGFFGGGASQLTKQHFVLFLKLECNPLAEGCVSMKLYFGPEVPRVTPGLCCRRCPGDPHLLGRPPKPYTPPPAPRTPRVAAACSHLRKRRPGWQQASDWALGDCPPSGKIVLCGKCLSFA